MRPNRSSLRPAPEQRAGEATCAATRSFSGPSSAVESPRFAVRHRSIPLCVVFIAILLLAAAPLVRAANMQPDDGSYRWGTQMAFNASCSTTGTSDCGPSVFTSFLPDPSTGVTSGAYAYTSDYAFGSFWQIGFAQPAQPGEQFTWVVTYPDGTTQTIGTLTYNGTTSQGSGCWSDSSGWSGCFPLTPGYIANYGWAVYLGCANPNSSPGQWTMAVYDNGALAEELNSDGSVAVTWQPVPFTVSHGGQLDITSPTDNELFGLDQQNYTATSAVPFKADDTPGDIISWSETLNYKTSGGYAITLDTLPSFGTSSGGEQDETYQSEGGQVSAEASTTASDGSTIDDCVTFYVDGPPEIPGPGTGDVITPELVTLYTGSQSYPTYDPTGQYPPTSKLMTGVAMTESSYAQFETPKVCPYHPDLWNLYSDYGILAKWPEEPYVYNSAGVCVGTDGGTHIGLMQMATTFPDAWDWTTNALDAVNLFSGTVSPNKIQLAGTYATDIINGDPKATPPIDGYSGLPQPVGNQLENMALVLYGGWIVKACGMNPSESCRDSSEYYIPSCSGTQGTTKCKGNTCLTCSSGWTWVPNTTNQPWGVNYVSKIMSNLQ